MLSTDLLTVILFLALTFIVLWQGIQIANLKQDLTDAIDTLRTKNARSISLAKMANVEASLSDLTDAYDSLLASHKKLRSRIGMRAVRDKRSEVPDPKTDPAGYKRAMRLKLNQAKL